MMHAVSCSRIYTGRTLFSLPFTCVSQWVLLICNSTWVITISPATLRKGQNFPAFESIPKLLWTQTPVTLLYNFIYSFFLHLLNKMRIQKASWWGLRENIRQTFHLYFGGWSPEAMQLNENFALISTGAGFHQSCLSTWNFYPLMAA